MQFKFQSENKPAGFSPLVRRSAPIFSIILAVFLLSMCDTDERLEFDDIPVVESYLSVNKPVSIQISRKTPYDDNVKLSSDIIENLEIKISYDGLTRIIPPVNDSVFCDSAFYPKEGVTYSLEFTFNQRTVSSSTQIPGKPVNFSQSVTQISLPTFKFGQGRPSGGPNMPNPVKLTWDNGDESYYMVVTENMETNPTEVFETNDTLDAPRRIFRNEPTQASQTEIAGMSFQYFGRHRLILFHLNADYAALYTNTGNTSQNLTNPITNITNGLGIFTGINSDTLYLNVLKE